MAFKLIILLLPFALISRPLYQEPWGKDSNLRPPPPIEVTPPPTLATRIADAIINFHQNVISPVDGPRSHFRPSSSQYMRLAIHRYGFVKGFLMGCDRLLRENSEEWVYRTVEYEGKLYKYDPAIPDKYHGMW
ncbi:MAG: membrane protein insertion efficiency factor YidD [Verrucomicrobiota bacterium]|nr:membrane protein insertion efficiency factor YidD [Verrucomicrobiota bacterium]